MSNRINSPETDHSQPPPAQSGQAVSRLKLIALLGTFTFPLLLATAWLYIVRANDGELGVSARGDLIKPAVPLTPFVLDELDAASFDEESIRGIWTMFYAPKGECADTCQKNLYHMRQVRLSLAQRMDRVQRAVLIEQDGQISAALIAEHQGLRVLSGIRSSILDQVTAATAGMPSQQEAIYLIDPFGNLMMRFPADLPPKSMLKDIKHLLKVSRIG